MINYTFYRMPCTYGFSECIDVIIVVFFIIT